MRNYLLSFLYGQGTSLPPFLVTQLVQLLCRVTKLGWFEADTHKELVDDACRFLQGAPPMAILGVKILTMLVQEMNQPLPKRSLTEHRKTAVNFRDNGLFKIFQVSLTSLKSMYAEGRSGEEGGRTLEAYLTLAQQTLGFDFVGTCSDESSEDLGTIQVPSSWRPIIEDPTTLQVFFDLYRTALSPPISTTALECLVRLSSVRRSIFSSDAERQRFLAHLIRGALEIMASNMGLASHDNYHELCRLLGRLKTNFQLAEIIAVDCYPEWINRVATLTVESLKSWQWASDSVFYLLGLWARLVSSVPYLKGDTPSGLDAFVPQITEAFVTSRLESVDACVKQPGSYDDPLDSEEAVGEQLDGLATMIRFQYESLGELVCAAFDPLLAQFTEIAAASPAAMLPGVTAEHMTILEGRTTWLVHLIGAVIKGRLSSTSAEAQEPLDGQLSARVFGLLRVMDQGAHVTRYARPSRQRLDAAVMLFFQSFRKVYVGEQAMTSSKVYRTLGETLGVVDHLSAMNLMVGKVAANIKAYRETGERVIHLSLELFQDLSCGYMSGKLLLKLDAVQFILQNHSAEHFGFLAHPPNHKSRTLFYGTLGRLLFLEDSSRRFGQFVQPMHQLLMVMQGQPATTIRAIAPKEAIVGLFRDLAGLTAASSTRRTFGMLFDWLYGHLGSVVACIEAFGDSPEVTTAILRFVAEFVQNKQQRLAFDLSSPNGILLFREVSRIVSTYAQLVLNMGRTSDEYRFKYKGIWLCLTILTRALSGGFCNFGVFELYGDRALADALDAAVRMILSIPLSEILAYRKVSRAYYGLLEVLCSSHMATLAMQETPTFAFIVASMESGLRYTAMDERISTQCSAALDHLLSFYFKHLMSPEDAEWSVSGVNSLSAAAMGSHARDRAAALRMAEHMQKMDAGTLPNLLKTVLELAVFEDSPNQWSLSRPLLPLILLNDTAVFRQIQEQLLSTQPRELQPQLAQCIETLMKDVEPRSLEAKNRDKFTQNVSVCRNDLKKLSS